MVKREKTQVQEMSVQRLILFCSTTSRACVPCIKFAYQNKLPVEIVRLDTQEARERVRHGRYFQIQVVPTLVVIRTGGKLQLFAGQEKVMSWFHSIISASRSHSRPKPPVPIIQEVSDDEDDLEPEFIEETGLYDSKSRKKSSKRNHKKSKKKSRRKKPPVHQVIKSDSEDEEVEIEFVSEPPSEYPDRPPPPPTNGLMVGPNAVPVKKGSSVRDIAKQMEEARKQMEKDRKNSVWYREDNY